MPTSHQNEKKSAEKSDGTTVFLSHTHVDKPVVEPIATGLRDIFGQENIFYDSWSIRPGDGIIDKMNDALAAHQILFFFVSQKSLKSKMVDLEWQASVFKAASGRCRIVPVRIDDVELPYILKQSVYIDMYSIGVDAALLQMVNVIQGNCTFTPQYLGFSNLQYLVKGDFSVAVIIEIVVSHLMEPNPVFLIGTLNSKHELAFEVVDGRPHREVFNKDFLRRGSQPCNAMLIEPLGGAITKKRPLRIEMKSITEAPISFVGLFHQESDNQWKLVPTMGESGGT